MKYSSIKSLAEEIKMGRIFPWLNRDANKIDGMIIGPDTDGFVSALFLNEIFAWKVIGFYDGKIFTITKNSDFENKKELYIFIDVEILRPNIKSIGHHILLYDAQTPHPLITVLEKTCIQPNNWRGKDVRNTFETKYPFGTFHLLLSILYYLIPRHPVFNFDPGKAIIPSIYIDGVFKNLFNYPKNCLDWLKYMTGDSSNHPFEKLLKHPTTPKDLMNLMSKFFDILNNVWVKGTEQKKGKLSLDEDIDFTKYQLKGNTVKAILRYLAYLAKHFNYTFNLSLWPIITSKLITFKLKKEITATTKTNYLRALNKKPVSFAVTSKARNGLEYTLDPNQIFDFQK